MKQLRAHILIKGQLHGLNFRYHTQQQAKKLGLSGYVRNIQNPRIDFEIEVQGDKDKVEEMLEWCQEEPHSSHITNILYRFDEPADHSSSFDIR